MGESSGSPAAQLKSPWLGPGPAARGEGHLPAHHSGRETKLTATTLQNTQHVPMALPLSLGGRRLETKSEFACGNNPRCVRAVWLGFHGERSADGRQ